MGEIVTTEPIIEGVRIRPLQQIGDDRGMVMHMLRADSPDFEGFGEIYFSTVKLGVVKAWKRHRRMVQNFAVPVGAIRLVIFDDRAGSSTCGVLQEITTGFNHYGLIRIPPMVWYGFKGMGENEAMIVNCASLPHDPLEVERADIDHKTIPYTW